MNEAGEAHTGDVARGTEYSLEVPDRLGGFGVVFVEEAAAVVFVEDAGEAPWVVLEWLHVLDLYEEDVSGLGFFDFEGAREVVDLC